MKQNRRTFISTVGAGIGATALASATIGGMTPVFADTDMSDLEKTFLDALMGAFNRTKRLAFLADDALIIAHDVPYPLSKEDYADHLAFHEENWQKLEVMPEALEIKPFGDMRVVSCYFNERGKPKNSGFRQRPGFLTATCVKDQNGWQAISLHTSALRSQILDASPS